MFKGTVSRDFCPTMFSLNKPMMAHDWPVTVFPNMDSISRRCSYWKFRIFIYKTYKTYKTNILKLNLLSSSKLPEVRIKTALTQRCHKITRRCHRRPWFRGGNDTAEFFLHMPIPPLKFFTKWITGLNGEESWTKQGVKHVMTLSLSGQSNPDLCQVRFCFGMREWATISNSAGCPLPLCLLLLLL